MSFPFRRVAFVGFGLMGGSLARAREVGVEDRFVGSHPMVSGTRKWLEEDS